MFELALHHLRYNKVLSTILILCMTIAIFLPLSTFITARMLDREMLARSNTTPLLIGSKGSPFLLTLNAIYFKTGIEDQIDAGTLRTFRQRCEGQVIPLHLGHSAKGFPVVGTTFDYFAFRGLRTASGRLPTLLGEAVVGWDVAHRLRLKPGSGLITDLENIYDISAEYPLKLKITGVLEQTGTPDDRAVFTDVKSAWVMDGIGHGHEDIFTSPDAIEDDSVLFIEASEVVYNSRLAKYTEITRENIDSFHFHGDESAFPLSALIIAAASDKERVLVKCETNLPTRSAELEAGSTELLQAVEPSEIIFEILALIFDIKRILDGFSGLVILSTAAFLFLVLSLLFRLRHDEMQIIYKIGGSRHAMEMLLGIETLILLAVSFILAAGLSFLLVAGARSFFLSG